MEKNYTIQLPEGAFAGNCSDCIHAEWDDRDDYGRHYCSYMGYVKTSERNGCFHYERED